MLDAETDEEVSRRDLVRGFEFEEDRYVLLDDDDFASARIDTSSTLSVEKFVACGAIQPIWFDTSYYMMPDGDAGQDVYAVLRDAIAQSGHVALLRVVTARRERVAAILPMENGMVLHTLHEPRDLYDHRALFDEAVRSGTRCASGCRDGEARDTPHRTVGDAPRACGPRRSLRGAAARGGRCQAEGRGIRYARTRDVARRQRDRPDVGAEAESGSGVQGHSGGRRNAQRGVRPKGEAASQAWRRTQARLTACS
jgi:hypothetical protein